MSTITKAFIQELGNRKLETEEQQVVEELNRRKIPYSFFTEKRIHRRQLPLGKHTLVVGNLPCILGALKQLNIPWPEPNDYPICLQDCLHRRTWQSTVSDLAIRLEKGDYPAIFAKPCSRRKQFTGAIFQSESDLAQVSGVSKYEPLICSEVVNWRSEYRVYVVRSQIRGIHHYEGNPLVQVNRDTVEKAIRILRESGEAYAGYAIDFGVFDSGKTALIEMNDGFAIGAYGISAQDYTDMILARWEELLSQSKT
ncbi:ATP-grasp domain-containing protein [Acaryochloris sp. 'Moss Beach']|uniref:ATP-grasp domain-containing protein n=1 Tax=Acaryochloris sp. 'Moss Beach' TaxID=2740837 RepID=UPI001F41837E|nr:ATP-grasp domain-containing protein [Acaryochloris sp. 'Moss Beach']UJB69732.1 ATP-grasp domain-containing protein [Acaryochloris sp. 'Moss Beach']